jgi:hypothetical protein
MKGDDNGSLIILSGYSAEFTIQGGSRRSIIWNTQQIKTSQSCNFKLMADSHLLLINSSPMITWPAIFRETC